VLDEIYVQPGESRLVKEPAILRTLLGSCVGVVFWYQQLGAGALCHPMLPRRPAKPAMNHRTPTNTRYVDFAIRNMASQFDALGARRSEVQIKLFGGADVLATNDSSTRSTVGAMNREVALQVIEEEGFRIIASSLGGTKGMTIRFHTGTGEVLLHRLA
jgi:chemotaxis protein CheD